MVFTYIVSKPCRWSLLAVKRFSLKSDIKNFKSNIMIGITASGHTYTHFSIIDFTSSTTFHLLLSYNCHENITSRIPTYLWNTLMALFMGAAVTIMWDLGYLVYNFVITKPCRQRALPVKIFSLPGVTIGMVWQLCKWKPSSLKFI